MEYNENRERENENTKKMPINDNYVQKINKNQKFRSEQRI